MTLAVSNTQGEVVEVEIPGAQADDLGNPEAAGVEEADDQAVFVVVDDRENCLDLGPGQDGGEVVRRPHMFDEVQVDLAPQYVREVVFDGKAVNLHQREGTFLVAEVEEVGPGHGLGHLVEGRLVVSNQPEIQVSQSREVALDGLDGVVLKVQVFFHEAIPGRFDLVLFIGQFHGPGMERITVGRDRAVVNNELIQVGF